MFLVCTLALLFGVNPCRAVDVICVEQSLADLLDGNKNQNPKLTEEDFRMAGVAVTTKGANSPNPKMLAAVIAEELQLKAMHPRLMPFSDAVVVRAFNHLHSQLQYVEFQEFTQNMFRVFSEFMQKRYRPGERLVLLATESGINKSEHWVLDILKVMWKAHTSASFPEISIIGVFDKNADQHLLDILKSTPGGASNMHFMHLDDAIFSGVNATGNYEQLLGLLNAPIYDYLKSTEPTEATRILGQNFWDSKHALRMDFVAPYMTAYGRNRATTIDSPETLKNRGKQAPPFETDLGIITNSATPIKTFGEVLDSAPDPEVQEFLKARFDILDGWQGYNAYQEDSVIFVFSHKISAPLSLLQDRKIFELYRRIGQRYDPNDTNTFRYWLRLVAPQDLLPPPYRPSGK